MTGGRHRALYGALLRLYPRSFRREYGDAMVQLFADELRDSGPKAWRAVLPDLIRTVPKQRIEGAMNRLSTGGRVVALAAAALSAAVLGVGTGIGAAPVLVLAAMVGVGVLLSQRRSIARLPFGPRAPLRHAVVQSWWAPIAALLGLATMVFGVGTAFEAHNWGGRVFGSTLLLLCGSGMLLGLAKRPFDRTSGNVLVLIGTVPSLMIFWLIVPAALALVVWAGVILSGFDDARVAESRS